MDRRGFLKTTGAAAVAAGTAGAAAAAADDPVPFAPAAPVVGALTPRRLVLASAWGPDMARPNADRLAHTLARALGGRFQIDVQPDADRTAETVEADLLFANPHALARAHPAFAFFAGLPAGLGLDAAALPVWLGVGGGQMLWDELAAAFGWKPLLAGHTGASAGLWATRRIEQPQDLAGLTIATAGLACDLARALGAEAVEAEPGAIASGLAGGSLQAAEWPGPLAALSPGLQPVAERLYGPALVGQGMALGLHVRRTAWERMHAADQAILQACAAQEHQLSLSEAWAHDSIVRQMMAPGKWPVQRPLAPAASAAIDEAARAVVARLEATGPDARRIGDSLRAFRTLSNSQTMA